MPRVYFFTIMKIQENIPLKDLTTFRIGGSARYFGVVKSPEDLHEAFSFIKTRKLPLFILGGGSNILLADHGFPGLVIKNEIKGIKFSDNGSEKVILEAGAGESFDEIVALAVSRNLSGLENLSGIPGTVGGAAVQNAGAYGAEIKDCLLSVEGFNSVNGKKFFLKLADCEYGYRNSLFKKNKKYIITSVALGLDKKPVINLAYAGLKNKLINDRHLTVAKIREAVLGIRAEKLPDWHRVGTAGSFFKNPVISPAQFQELKEKYAEIPGFPEKNGRIKVSLAWILDKICAVKGYQAGTVALYETQPIVLVNLGGATEKDVSNFVDKIKKIVKEKTGIEIECEVEMIN